MSKNDLTFKFIDGDAEANFGLGEGSVSAEYRKDTGAETSLNLINVNAKVGASFFNVGKGFADGAGKVSVHGPGGSAEAGIQLNHERIGVDAMLEASAAKAKVSAGGAFLEANLNANTGAKIGTDGVKFAGLGWGLTLGVGGRWSVDTPFGSIGGEPDGITMEETITDSNTNTNEHLLYAK